MSLNGRPTRSAAELAVLVVERVRSQLGCGEVEAVTVVPATGGRTWDVESVWPSLPPAARAEAQAAIDELRQVYDLA